MLIPAAAGGYVAWENRNTVVSARIGDVTWTGHLYAVLVVGALLACWVLLGAGFIQCRIAERRRARAAPAPAAEPTADDGALAAAQHVASWSRAGALRTRPALQR